MFIVAKIGVHIAKIYSRIDGVSDGQLNQMLTGMSSLCKELRDPKYNFLGLSQTAAVL
jgi:hypothetical protein